jgi:hypothetical protein
MLFASQPLNEVRPAAQREYEISNELGLHHLHTIGRELITDLTHVMGPGTLGRLVGGRGCGVGSPGSG